MKDLAPAARMVKPSSVIALAALPLALAACAGPPITSPIEGEPVCSDFEVGVARTKMLGGLRFPVQLTIKSGSNVAFKTTLVGLRTSKDLATRVLLADDDETLTLEWAQCENERAPKPVEPTGREAKGIAKYECGNATVYKTDQLTTKKGDPASHTITFAAPPNAACWQTAAPAPAANAGAPDAGSADAAPPAAEADAGAPDPDAGTTDAGTTGTGDAGTTGTGDAGTTGAAPTSTAATDAGKDAAKPK